MTWRRFWGGVLTVAAFVVTCLTVYHMIWRTSPTGVEVQKLEIQREIMEIQLKMKQADVDLVRANRGPETIVIPSPFASN